MVERRKGTQQIFGSILPEQNIRNQQSDTAYDLADSTWLPRTEISGEYSPLGSLGRGVGGPPGVREYNPDWYSPQTWQPYGRGGPPDLPQDPRFTPERMEEDQAQRDKQEAEDILESEKMKEHYAQVTPQVDQTQIGNIIDKATRGKLDAKDYRSIFNIQESLYDQYSRIVNDQGSYNDDGTMTDKATAQLNLIQSSMTGMDNFRTRMDALNTSSQTQTREGLGRELASQLAQRLFPDLIPEGTQIDPDHLTFLLDVARFNLEQEELDAREAAAGRAPDVTVFRGFEGGSPTPTRMPQGMMA